MRLRELGVPLKKKKSIDTSKYTLSKVRDAIIRAENLHLDKNDLSPHYFASTVYMLLNKLIEMLPENICESSKTKP